MIYEGNKIKIIQEVGIDTEPEVIYRESEGVIYVKYDDNVDKYNVGRVDKSSIDVYISNGILTIEVVKDEDTNTE